MAYEAVFSAPSAGFLRPSAPGKARPAGCLAPMAAAAAAAALAMASPPSAPAYFGVLNTKAGRLSLLHRINDALMALFFLLAGLEIKREFLDGQPRHPGRRRACADHPASALTRLVRPPGLLAPHPGVRLAPVGAGQGVLNPDMQASTIVDRAALSRRWPQGQSRSDDVWPPERLPSLSRSDRLVRPHWQEVAKTPPTLLMSAHSQSMASEQSGPD